MAKIEEIKSRSSTLAEDHPQDAFYRPAAPSKLRPEFPPPRYQPEDPQEEEAFLRTRRRVPVRRRILPRTRAGQIALAAGILAGLAGLAMLAVSTRDLLKHDPRFRIDSSDSIQILGNSHVTTPELLSVFGSDIGRNVFFVPLGERRAALEKLPWVEHATVMRLLPNQLRVAIVERTPVAFVRTGNEIGLVDASGVILTMPPATMAAKHYSFPVVTGIDPGDPLSTRSPRMHIYRRFIDALDASGENLSAQLSEVDLSDPEDVKAVLPGPGSDILLHFGDRDFLARFHNYQQHLPEWRQQYPHLASVDLRYEREVVLEMDKATTAAATAAASQADAKRGPQTASLTADAAPQSAAHGIAHGKPAPRPLHKSGHLSKRAHPPARHAWRPAAYTRPYSSARPASSPTETPQ